MRKSAAPSCQSTAKRLRFLSPFLNDKFQIDKENDLYTEEPVQKEMCFSSSNWAPKFNSLLSEKETLSDGFRSTDDILKLISEPISEIKNNEKIGKQNQTIISSNVKDVSKNAAAITPFFVSKKKFVAANNSEHYAEDLHSNQTASNTNIKEGGFSFNVLWCKRSSKKHKVWEGDGILTVNNRSAVLKDMEGKVIDRGIGYKLKEIEELEEGSKFCIGGKQCEIQSLIYSSENSGSQEKDTSPYRNCKNKDTFTRIRPLALKFKKVTAKLESKIINESPSLLLPIPTVEHQKIFNKEHLPLTDVKVAPFLARQLRPHQKEGVIFMYKCILGVQHEFGQGVILADEMGLGKTLQCIVLIWTLYEQGPYGKKPLLKRIIIITPSSLVTNWKKEFHKWLGESRLSVFSIGKKNSVEDFIKSHNKVLIISYEMFLRSAELLSSIQFDLVICDEGHRIKNLNNKISTVVNCLSTPRRILLTGTPIQNDLAEYFSIVDFVNPGALGSIQSFRRSFEKPILQLRNPDCSESEREIGEEKSAELSNMSTLFMLRRTQEVINQYLPPKSEIVVFCRPTEVQRLLYKSLLNFSSFRRMLSDFSDPSLHLIYISILRKLCNHPALLYDVKNFDGNNVLRDLQSVFPYNYQPSPADSGKMKVLETIIDSIFLNPKKEKIVIVSGFTQTLNLIQQLCEYKKYLFLRLDGSTATSSRQELVDIFNRSYTKYDIFLLSSKAGGVGFNLIGASRILLYDIDWNPANDLQAMARIWRDGQRHSVFIYRLLTTGTIEEKIYQRQVSKQCLSGSVLNPNSNKNLKFSHDELKDLFTFHEDTDCLTHDLINCPCLKTELYKGNDYETNEEKTIFATSYNIGMAELMKWEHIPGPISAENIKDFILASGSKDITFLFRNKVQSTMK